MLFLVVVAAGAANASCEAPPHIVANYLKMNPDWALLTGEQLDRTDLEEFTERNPGKCPGIAAGDFFGTGARAYAVATVRFSGGEMTEKVDVVREIHGKIDAVAVVQASHFNVPRIIIAMPRGVYQEFDRGKRVRTRNQGIFFVNWGASAILYYVAGGRFRSLLVEN